MVSKPLSTKKEFKALIPIAPRLTRLERGIILCRELEKDRTNSGGFLDVVIQVFQFEEFNALTALFLGK
ncbi:MAG: hypothetical protein ACFFD4_17305 [Candidatus Odinarchaeota archaeon]